MATVLIIGASRGIGLEAVNCALEAGHIVRALARSARRIPVDHPNLAKVSADARDQAALAGALEGVDAVVQALGVPAGQDMMLKPVCLFSDATRVLIAAMEEAGVKRLIAVTGFGAGDSRDRGGCLYNTAFHLFLGRAYDDKDVQEDLIQDSGLDWVIARPVILTKGSRTGKYRVLVEPRSWRTGFILASRAPRGSRTIGDLLPGAEAILSRASIQRPNLSIRIAPLRLALDHEGLAADGELIVGTRAWTSLARSSKVAVSAWMRVSPNPTMVSGRLTIIRPTPARHPPACRRH